jgi:large subunit ribosomal protein L4
MARLQAPFVGRKGNAPLEEAVFAVPAVESLLHEVVKAEQAAKRQGTHATKTRGQVAGGRAKPYRQKGTGRARQGTTRAAQFRGGGAVFGPQPRSYELKVNRKAYRKARCMAWSLHAAEGSLGVFRAGEFSAPRTKDALALVAPWRGERPLVVVVDGQEDAAALSFRNIERTVVLTPQEVEVVDLLWARSVLVSEAALAQVHHMLGAGGASAGAEGAEEAEPAPAKAAAKATAPASAGPAEAEAEVEA